STVSPTATCAAETSTCSPSRRTTATSGATATSSARAERVLVRVRTSSAWPIAKRKVTAAASQYSPMITAPVAATVTSRSMLMLRTASARTAAFAIGVPATTAAATMRTLLTVSEPRARATKNAARISPPDTAEIRHGPCHQRLVLLIMCSSLLFEPVRGTSWVRAARSERRGLGRVAGLCHGRDEGLDVRRLRVVVDLDALRGEVDLDGVDAVDTAHLLLDLGDARRAREALGAQDSAGVVRGSGGHD